MPFWGPGSDEGVSPIVGTLLVVAMTMVLAAAIFVFAGGFGEKAEKAPHISFYKDGSRNSVTVIKVDSGVDWWDFDFSKGTCEPTLNEDLFPAGRGRWVEAGDTLGCEPSERLVIVASKPNQQIYETSFA